MVKLFKDYDVIVVGGGHAGLEAALAVANMGGSVLLITMNLQNIGLMSCNPAIGGIAKGQIVKEIDALGGGIGLITDRSMIQFRMLNKSKGPAMWSPRAQCDRMKFSREWKKLIEYNKNIDLYQDLVDELLIDDNKVYGVKTILDVIILAKSVILTNGTFLNGIIYIGNKKLHGGRLAESNVNNLTKQLFELGFKYGRMKTGTSPRVDKRSLDYSAMIKQENDDYIQGFSFWSNNKKLFNRCNCYITYTNVKVHEILKNRFSDSPMFNGSIKSKGPRYCPSIEDKIFRFHNKDSHQIFVEPEGMYTNEVYLNGFSTSLPIDVQLKSLKKVKGFENIKVLKFGYAIEYDYFHPTQLHHTLETKLISNLFFAGQINGTTGYEEAAGQGIIAGINAYLKISHKPPFILSREQAYIGVLIDDLVTKGTEEPYRMFTSRAEYRMLLRQDNADERLSFFGYELGLISKNRMTQVKNKLNNIYSTINLFNKTYINKKDINSLNKINNLNNNSVTISSILSRPEINIRYLLKMKFINHLLNITLSEEELESISIYIKYKGYIDREQEHINKISNIYNIQLPNTINYHNIPSLSNEAKEKLTKYKPLTLKDAYSISGISINNINILLLYIKSYKK
jgi:tRNA uridine 5-carboxymethylaminomethyl modification enzyme